MSKVTLSQFSFNRGELDPVLHGRSDWKYYYSGAEKIRNMVTRPQGGAVKRGGLRLVVPALDDDKPSFLVPFRFSVKQSYMLEFGDRRMRVIKDGGVVVFPDGHERAGEEVMIETPYPIHALAELRHAQTADVMILTHADYAPRRLSRHDHHDWRFSNLVTNSRTPAPEGVSVRESGGDWAKYVITASSSAGGESPPSEAITDAHPGAVACEVMGGSFSQLYWWLYHHDYSYMPSHLRFHSLNDRSLINFLRGCGYYDRGKGEYSDGGTQKWRLTRPNGAQDELWWWPYDLSRLTNECLYACDAGWAGNVGPALVAQVEKYVAAYNAGLPRTRQTRLEWRAVENAASYRVYRELDTQDGPAFRLIGETSETEFFDRNLAAYPGGLPVENDLFTGHDDYPGVCAFFEQRLILARTNNKPTTFWGSDTGLYNSFSRHTPYEDSDSYEFTLSSGEMNEIHWVVPLNDMLLGTSGGEWKAGGGGQAITPTNINARVQSWYGCSPLNPVVVGRSVVFAGRSRQTIRNFSYSLEADGYAGRDLTAYASHLFAGRTIVCMCFQQEPSGMVWVVLSDGGLLSCTFSPEEDVVAWSRHDTRGRFENCSSLVDMDGTDQVYFCVAREIGGRTRRFIETLEDAADAVLDETGGFFVDCGLTYTGEPIGRLEGLDHLEGQEVACIADGCVFPGLAVVGGALELPDGFTASIVHVGLPYAAELVTLDMEPESGETLRNRSRFAVSATLMFEKTRECLYGHTGGTLSEMKFRTSELAGRPPRLFTGEKQVSFSSPPGARAVRLRFVSESPTPFTLLGVIAEAACGQPA